jgi:hypothetical protein
MRSLRSESEPGSAAFGAAVASSRIVSRSEASAWESEPWLAASPDGRSLVATWTSRLYGSAWVDQGPIGYAISRDGGATWQAPRTLEFPGRETPFNVKVASDARGDFWAAWIGRSDSDKDEIVAARLRSSEDAFDAAVAVTDRNLEKWYDLPAIVTHRGTVFAAYAVDERESDAPCIATEVSRSADGVAWTRSTAAPCEPTRWLRNLNALCASEASERVWLAYVVGTSDRAAVEIRYSPDNGRTWPIENVRVLSAPDERVSFDPLGCVADADGAWVVYGVSDDPIVPSVFPKLSSIPVVHLDDTGNVEKFEAKDPSVRFAMHPQIARDDAGSIHVLHVAGTRDGDGAGSIRWTELGRGRNAFRMRGVVATPLRFQQRWGAPGFLGDYFGVVARGSSLMTAYARGEDADVHIAFSKWATALAR